MKEIEKTEPEFTKIVKKNSFRIPDNYFEEFPDKLFKRIESENKPVKVRHLVPVTYRSSLAIAATILAIAVIGYLTVLIVSTDKPGTQLAAPEIAEYIEYYASELDESDYYDLLDESYTDESIEDNYEDVVINYLVDQNIDFQTIVEEL